MEGRQKPLTTFVGNLIRYVNGTKGFETKAANSLAQGEDCLKSNTERVNKKIKKTANDQNKNVSRWTVPIKVPSLRWSSYLSEKRCIGHHLGLQGRPKNYAMILSFVRTPRIILVLHIAVSNRLKIVRRPLQQHLTSEHKAAIFFDIEKTSRLALLLDTKEERE